jgi:hypothetical protein
LSAAGVRVNFGDRYAVVQRQSWSTYWIGLAVRRRLSSGISGHWL